MTFAAIMVQVDFGDSATQRIKAAADLAVRFGALLIGVAGWPLRGSGALDRSDVQYPPQEQVLETRVLRELDDLGKRFRLAAGAVLRGVEWRSSDHFPSEVIAAEARAADLVIIGRDRLPGDVYRTFDPAAVILACGRPVLVLPRGVERVQGQRILVAWKGTREARRAVYDALPLLKQAQSVSIAAVEPADLQERAREHVADVARYLEHHRVPLGRQIVGPPRAADGQAVLSIARELEVDLIVAGAYGRSRLSEWIFGGVTRDLLTASTVPCLFSN